MEQTPRGMHFLAAVLVLVILLLHQKQIDAAAATTNDTEPNTAKGNSVKPPSLPAAETVTSPPPQSKAAAAGTAEKPVEINENPEKPKPATEKNAHPTTKNVILPVEDNVHIEHSNPKTEMDFADSFTPVYYILVALSSSAILLLVARVYRLRLSRAERKYGVQGDRANQELTPLPMAIEDVNSDEDEDHTLFEVNRQSIRIL
ncbi:membrane protein FAM174A [Drosophila innubila]|uniref:membrane protein FAM174A n=1 Tax=Drosophila innubila TaxID=198719 RepID=UPI00148D70CA|nr:membrane protein FAM174A [Drosophila innubila]